MPSLKQSLEGKDLGHIQIVAELWGVELQAQDVLDAISQLDPALLKSDLVEEIIEALPRTVQNAIINLQTENGRIPWSQFTRKYGTLRKLGPARRDKEKIHRDPQSTSEWLWYRAFIGRDFFDTVKGPTEFAYIPEDLLALIPPPTENTVEVFGRPARPKERAELIPASDRILDQACTLLAALRMRLADEELAAAEDWQMKPALLTALLRAANILEKDDHPKPTAVRQFLEADRGDALAQLTTAWLHAADYNELRLLPGLRIEGNWKNDPVQTRDFVLDSIAALPADTWWNIASLIADIKERRPDFQRPAGDYDSWYLRDAQCGDYLRGFEHWDRVDAALIKFIVTGPLHWLGILNLAAPEKGANAASFRLSKSAQYLLAGAAPEKLKAEDDKLSIDSQGQIQASRYVPRAARYQLARFCTWEEPKKGLYRYRLEAASLQKARSAGLEISQLLSLLKSHASTPIAPNLLQALKRWEKQGTQAKMSEMIVLRLSSAAMLKALRASRAARYLGDPLGPNAIEVKAGARAQVLRVLTELGYLGECRDRDS